MKKLSVLLLFTAFFSFAYTQNNVGIKSDNTPPDPSAKLDIQSTTQGVLIPRLTTAQRNAMPQKAPGLLVYDTDKQTVYLYNGVTWTPLAATTTDELQPMSTTAPSASSQLYYGCSVDMSGEWAIVGAYGYDLPGKTDCGGAYVYKRTNGIWELMQILTDTDAQANDRFGWAVAIDGNRIVIGAMLDDVGANADAGSAHFYEYNGTEWVFKRKESPGDGAAGDYFGYSVAIEDRWAIVGAMSDDGTQQDQGSAYIYRFEDAPIDTWVFDYKIFETVGMPAFSRLGTSVSISGGQAAVGVPGFNSNGGIVFIHRRGSSDWAHRTNISISAPAGSRFGQSVSIKNGILIVGAPNMNLSGVVKGAVYSWALTSGGWLYNADAMSPDGVADDRYGYSVAFRDNILVVGAYAKTINGNTFQGRSYVFKMTGSSYPNFNFQFKRKITDNNGMASDMMGQTVATSNNNVLVGGENPNQARGKVMFLNVEE